MRRPGGFAISVALLAAFHVLVIFAGWFAPYRYDTQDREHPYAPPSRIHFVDASGQFHWRPFVYGLKSGEDAPLEYKEQHTSAEWTRPDESIRWGPTDWGATSSRACCMVDRFPFSPGCWPRPFRWV